jgi:acyl-CoA thioesterase II
MAQLNFEESVVLRQVADDTFENIHSAWTWPRGTVVPGGLMMAMATAAAMRTLPEDYALDNLHCQFLAGPRPDKQFKYCVQRLSDGRRFRARAVNIEQDGRYVASITMSFISESPWNGPAMQHTVNRVARDIVDQITIDDLEQGRGPLGGFMKFQRLPLIHSIPQAPQTSIEPVVAHIIGPIKAPAGTLPHVLGLLNLSDYHVLGAAPALHGLDVGVPAIGDASRTLTHPNFKLYTSLNHTIHIHSYDFRADEMIYIEVTSSWAADGRALMHTRLFSKAGKLIASCVQEAYYVLKPDAKSRFGSKL